MNRRPKKPLKKSCAPADIPKRGTRRRQPKDRPDGRTDMNALDYPAKLDKEQQAKSFESPLAEAAQPHEPNGADAQSLATVRARIIRCLRCRDHPFIHSSIHPSIP